MYYIIDLQTFKTIMLPTALCGFFTIIIVRSKEKTFDSII